MKTATPPVRSTIRRHQLREMVPMADSTIYEWSNVASSPVGSQSRHLVSFVTWPRSRLG